MLEQFSLSTLRNLQNGAVDAQFREMVKEILRELEARPHVKAARKITLDFLFTPVMEAGALDDVLVDVSFKSSVPKYESRQYRMSPRVQDGEACLLFQPSSPDQPRQHTIDELPRNDDDNPS